MSESIMSATGRFSPSDPELQNIPIQTETGREIRLAFVSHEEKFLSSVDYAQIELRVPVCVSGDLDDDDDFDDDDDDFDDDDDDFDDDDLGENDDWADEDEDVDEDVDEVGGEV